MSRSITEENVIACSKHEALVLCDDPRWSIPAARDLCVAGSPSGLRNYDDKRADSKWQPDSRRKKNDSIFRDF